MSPIPEESVSYEDALFRLNDLCGKRVAARVSVPDGEILAVEGTLIHDDEEAGVWGSYRVGDAKLDVTDFQGLDGHWAIPGATSFHGYGVRVDVWALGDEKGGA